MEKLWGHRPLRQGWKKVEGRWCGDSQTLGTGRPSSARQGGCIQPPTLSRTLGLSLGMSEVARPFGETHVLGHVLRQRAHQAFLSQLSKSTTRGVLQRPQFYAKG